jgi:hypothetical protein
MSFPVPGASFLSLRASGDRVIDYDPLDTIRYDTILVLATRKGHRMKQTRQQLDEVVKVIELMRLRSTRMYNALVYRLSELDGEGHLRRNGGGWKLNESRRRVSCEEYTDTAKLSLRTEKAAANLIRSFIIVGKSNREIQGAIDAIENNLEIVAANLTTARRRIPKAITDCTEFLNLRSLELGSASPSRSRGEQRTKTRGRKWSKDMAKKKATKTTAKKAKKSTKPKKDKKQEKEEVDVEALIDQLHETEDATEKRKIRQRLRNADPDWKTNNEQYRIDQGYIGGGDDEDDEKPAKKKSKAKTKKTAKGGTAKKAKKKGKKPVPPKNDEDEDEDEDEGEEEEDE